MTEIVPRIGLRPVKILATCIVAMLAVGAHAGTFSAKVLLGVDRLYVAVDGIPAKFERNGLTAGELRKRTEDRLSAYGIEIVSEAVAVKDNQAAQLLIKLNANEDASALVFYRVSVQLKRKLPLDATGQSFISETVWSDGRSGVIDPFNLGNVYGYVGEILEKFIAAHGRHNVPSRAALTP